MIEQVRCDLTRSLKKAETGRSGLTPQQILRSASTDLRPMLTFNGHSLFSFFHRKFSATASPLRRHPAKHKQRRYGRVHALGGIGHFVWSVLLLYRPHRNIIKSTISI
jgi:hypothetical protein